MTGIDNPRSAPVRIMAFKEELAELSAGHLAVIACGQVDLDGIPDRGDGLRLLILRSNQESECFILSSPLHIARDVRATDLVKLPAPPSNIAAIIGPSDTLKQLIPWWTLT